MFFLQISNLMRCLNMKIGDVLFFILNIIAIYSMKFSQDNTSQTTTNETFNENFDRNCPHLSKIIRDNNLTDYTINCKLLNVKNVKVNEENVLGYACLIIKKFLNFMCENKINITTDTLIRPNVSSLCPFNFSHLEKLGLSDNMYIDELKNPDHCSQICSDLYSKKTQCIVLHNFNNYLKQMMSAPDQEDLSNVRESVPGVKSEHTEVIKQNTEIGVSTLLDKVQQSQKTNIKEVTKEVKVEAKTETKSSTTDTKLSDMKTNVIKPVIEEKKTEKTVSSTPNQELKPDKKEEVQENDKKVSEDDNYIPENNESKPKNENLNEDEEILNEDDLSSLSEPIPIDTTGVNQIPKLPKIERPEVIMDSSIKSKEIYSGEGFFQAEDSHFFFYFIMISSIIVVGYLAFHNKNKILAYALEGTSGRRSRRRPNPARYRKLETNLEEVISSNATNAASSSVVY